MESVKRRLIELVRFHGVSIKQATAVPGLTLYRSDRPTAPVRSLYNPRVCVVLQGSKEIVIDREVIDVGPDDYLVVVLDLPVSARISQASAASPHYALTLDLDPEIIADVATDGLVSSPGEGATKGAATSPLTIDILEPFERLARLLDRPSDIKVLAPLFQRELVYRLIQGGLGDMLLQTAQSTSRLGRVARTIGWIKAHFHEPFVIADLADMAGMSQTTYHRAFKAATSISPLQFRTRLRLHEARRQLQLGADSIGAVAYAVGYESQSQFNREYRKLFDRPPGDDSPE
ncbi:hypothetical protein KCV01_g2447, partial [Aureobasidium melanogenum]